MLTHPIGRRIGLGAAALVAAAALLLAPNAVSDLPAASGANCSDAEVVFARGTSEPAGLGRVGQALVESLRSQTSGMNIGTYAVNYSASRLQLHGGDGAKDVINHVKSMASSCPNTKIVLGGYSQGADVIDIVSGVPLGGITWGDSLPPEYANNVAAVAVFGNVANRTGGSLPSQSAMFGSKSIDLCNPDDPICHAGPGNEWAGHTEGYVPVYTTQAATFVAGKLMVGYSQTPPSSVPSTAPSATPGSTIPQAPSNPDVSASLTPSPTAQTPVPAVPVESTD